MKQINFNMLVLARQMRQMTQKDVALKAGIAQGTLSKAENGFLSLSEDNISSLCDVYDLPLGFFCREDDVSQSGHFYFRKKLTISDKVIDSFLAKVNIIKYITDDVMQPMVLPEYTLSSYVPDEKLTPSDIARIIRYEMGIYRGSIGDLTTLIENNGIIIIPFDFGTDKIDSIAAVTSGNRKIMFLNTQMPNDRIRYTKAHELGHFVMHMIKPAKSAEDAEDQADAFASEFLMPEKEIRSSLYNLTFANLAVLKKRWGVSMRALVKRAYVLNCIDYNTYRSFQISFSKKGYNKVEPIPLSVEEPVLFKEALDLYKTTLGYSEDEIISLMRISKSDYENWFEKKSNVVTMIPKYSC